MLKVIRNAVSHLGDLLIWTFYIVFPVIVGLMLKNIFFNRFSENHPITSGIIEFIPTSLLNIVTICVGIFFANQEKR
jgi:hypothetical protein